MQDHNSTIKVTQIYVWLFLFLVVNCISVKAQNFQQKPQRVPIGLTNYKKGDTYVKVTYGRPSMSHEKQVIFGNRIPFRKLWRTGDDHATEITITDTVEILGKVVPPATYAFFTIPDTAEWTVILNKVSGQWGHFKYNPTENLIKTQVPLYRSPKPILEFTIYLEPSRKGVDMVLVWEYASIRLPIRFREEER